MNRYLLGIIVRVLIISLSSFLTIWFYQSTNRPATTLFFLLLLVISIGNLIYFLNRVNRDLINFLVYLQENDTSLTFSKNRIERNFKDITVHLNHIIHKIQEERLAKEGKHQYLHAVVDHIGIGLISFNDKGEIELINPAAKQILGLGDIRNIDVLSDRFPELGRTFLELSTNSQNLVKVNTKMGDFYLSVKATSLRFNNSRVRLVSFYDIRYELEAQELDSWRKLIRMLRHEIMNSMTPITTLTTAIKRAFENNHQPKSIEEICIENVTDALESAALIEERSKGLISFVEKFKSLTNLSNPYIRKFRMDDFFENLRRLFANELLNKRIQLDVEIEKGSEWMEADENLMEQVLINLVKNSMEAIHSVGGKIVLRSGIISEKQPFIRVTDNGSGIKTEDIGNIFVPSFTTKENGTGIGLNISRQIMQMHQGTITVKFGQNDETCFELLFPVRLEGMDRQLI